MKEIEITFGAKDSDLIQEEYYIPDGYEAIIEGNKVIIRRQENEDEKIRNKCMKYLDYEYQHCGEEDKKEIEKCIAWLEKQKSVEWSEEDENRLNNIINLIRGGAHYAYEEEIEWLKSLKPQNHWKPTDEQMTALECASHGYLGYNYGKFLQSLYNDLKKLK